MARPSARYGLVLAIVAAALVACGGSPPATPTATPTAAPSPTDTAPPTTSEPTLSPTPTPTAGASTGTAQPTLGAPGAHRAMEFYAEALVAAQYQDAWNMLGPGCRTRWGSLSAFTKDRTARMKTAGPVYTVQINPKTLPLGNWLVGVSWVAEIDQANAYLFSLKWAGFGSDPRGTEIWIASPTIIGWALYLAN